MPYKYFDAYLKVAESTPKETYINDFQQLLNEQFYNTSEWSTIQEETAFASGAYQNVDVRINGLIDVQTGKNMSDDFKRLLFKDLTHNVSLGSMYQFGSNYWVAFNVDKIESLKRAVSIRRCNNTLRFIDTNGAYHSLPCVVDYLIKENRDYSTAGTALVIPSGTIEVLVQANNDSNLILSNKRFLFGRPGNWVAYRVTGGGIANFNNNETLNNTSQGLIRFTMTTSYVNNLTDDLINGVADIYENEYAITLIDKIIAGIVGGTTQLVATITQDGQSTTREFDWNSSDINVATVNSTGLVTYQGLGYCEITCSLKDNPAVFDIANVTVSSTPLNDYRVVISPTTNYLLEGQERDYTVYLYRNGVQQANTFTFTPIGSVPSANYTLTTLNGNQFRLKNNAMYLSSSLSVRCTPSALPDQAKDFSINLRGAW